MNSLSKISIIPNHLLIKML